MKTNTQIPVKILNARLLAAGLLGLTLGFTSGAEPQASVVDVTTVAGEVAGRPADSAKGTENRRTVVKTLKLDPEGAGAVRRDIPWLGLATEEVSEVLTSQLGLDPGVGLVVTYVAPESPAAKAGVQKNDVLVEFEGHALVHPAQLRRLVQVRKEGDTVQLTCYRAGKKETYSVTLAKGSGRFGLLGEDGPWPSELEALKNQLSQLRDLHIDKAIGEKMKDLRSALGHLRLDQEEWWKDARASMEEAQKELQEALQNATNAQHALGPMIPLLGDLARGGIAVNKDATVTVHSSNKSVQTTVKADDTGVYVVVATPRKRLTAHDREGQLLFDGEIETAEQQAKVPREIWEKVEPLLDKLTTPPDHRPGTGAHPDTEDF